MIDEERQKEETVAPEGNDKLIGELEALYHKVAALDAPDVEPDNVVNFHAAYNILQIAPDASWQEIQVAYKTMSDAWREDLYPQVPFWNEKAAHKRREIERAYESLIKFYSLIDKGSGEEPGTPGWGRGPVHTFLDPAEIEAASVKSEDVLAPAVKTSLYKYPVWLYGTVFMILLMAVCIYFFWPELYRYETLKVSDQLFPLRIHRLTGDIAYHDGTGWRRPPLRQDEPRPSIPAPVAEKSSPSPSQLMEIQISTPVTVATSPIKDKTEITTEKSSPEHKSYRIQIAAFPDHGRAVAEVERLKNEYQQISIEETTIKGKGVWSRVLVGDFAGLEEGRRFLRKSELERRYPGSFVRKANGN